MSSSRPQESAKGPLQRAFQRCFSKFRNTDGRQQPQTEIKQVHQELTHKQLSDQKDHFQIESEAGQREETKNNYETQNNYETVISEGSQKSTKKSNIDSEDLVNLGNLSNDYSSYFQKFKAKVKSSEQSKDQRYISSRKFRKLPNKVQAKVLSSAFNQPADRYELQRLVAQSFTLHGYNYSKFRQNNPLPIDKPQYNILINDVMKTSFEAMVQLFKSYKLYEKVQKNRGKILKWKDSDSDDLKHAEDWMPVADLVEFNKLINYVYQINKEVILRVGIENLYVCIRRRWRKKQEQIQATKLVRKDEFINKLSRVKLQASQTGVLKKVKIEPNMMASQIAKETAELFVVYKAKDIVEEKISKRHENCQWVDTLIKAVVMRQVKAGLQKLFHIQTQATFQEESMLQLDLSPENIDRLTTATDNQNLKASLVQFNICERTSPDAVRRLMTEVDQEMNQLWGSAVKIQ